MEEVPVVGMLLRRRPHHSEATEDPVRSRGQLRDLPLNASGHQAPERREHLGAVPAASRGRSSSPQRTSSLRSAPKASRSPSLESAPYQLGQTCAAGYGSIHAVIVQGHRRVTESGERIPRGGFDYLRGDGAIRNATARLLLTLRPSTSSIVCDHEGMASQHDERPEGPARGQANRPARDLSRSIACSWMWGVPALGIVLGDAGASAGWLTLRAAGAIWVLATAWIATSCAVNAHRCSRTHCRINSILLPFLVLAGALNLVGAVSFPWHGYQDALLILVALSFVPECLGYRYLRRS